ncbi:MAG: adenine glycosylase [Cyanobacteria bacterium RYN_339]|nr:adenine glycosylase [Cyanobacteria bacterium RYN_339]
MTTFADRVIAWGRTHGRRFPWREPGLSTFELLLTEVLLARTRADAVVPVIDALLTRFPDATALATADLAILEAILTPLGLFRKRARALIPLAQKLVSHHGSHVPQALEPLLELPYVGRYAANAYLCFGLGQRRPVVDANVARLLDRYWGLTPWKGKLEHAEAHWQFAESLLPWQDVQRYNWGLLDLGALVCKPRTPDCRACPLREGCKHASAPPE